MHITPFSDDRRFIAATREALMLLLAGCVRATKSKRGIIHHGKMDCFMSILLQGVPTLHVTPVPEYDTNTWPSAT